MDSEGTSGSNFGGSLQFVQEDPNKPFACISNSEGPDFDPEDDEDCDDTEKRAADEPPPKKKTKGRVKIKMEFIENKLRRYTTFSKRKTGIMKKAYELSTLTGTQVMLLVASETGHVYTFATPKLQPMITSESGKALIQTCLNTPDAVQMPARNRMMSSTGFEENDISYGSPEDESKSNPVFTTDAASNGGSGATSPLVSPTQTSQLPPSSPSLQPALTTPPLQPHMLTGTSGQRAPATMAPPPGMQAFRVSSVPSSSPSPVFSSLSGAVQAAPPPLSQLLQAPTVASGSISASPGMVLAPEHSVNTAELFGPAGVMPGLVATKRPMVSSGNMVYDANLYHELSGQSVMTNPNASSSTDSHCLPVAH